MRPRTARRLLLACAALTIAADAPRAAAIAEPVEVRAAAGSGEPALSQSPDGTLVLSWLEPGGGGTTALRFSRWLETRWSRPLTVVERDSLFVNWADVPAVQPVAGDTLVAHWLQRTAGGTYDYAVRVARSLDGGSNWGAPFTVHGGPAVGEHGFVSQLAWPAGGTAIVWLDGRRMAAHADPDAGMAEGDMTLRHAVLRPDGTLGPETLLDARTCECCPTAAARTRDGVAVVYRDRSEREIRDIFIVQWDGRRWSDPRPVARDGWEVAGCPVNGPAIAAQGDTVVVAWYTGAQDTARVHVAFSRDGGATFAPPVRADEGDPTGRADVALLADGSACVSWIEGSTGVARIRARRITTAGHMGPALTIAATSAARRAGYPRIARHGGQLVCTWTEPTQPTRVRSARIAVSDLPR